MAKLTADEQADVEINAVLERRRIRKEAEAAAVKPTLVPTPTEEQAASDAAGHAKSAFDAGVDAIKDIFKNAAAPNRLGISPLKKRLQPRRPIMKVMELDPPFNPQGMKILKAADKGMNPTPPPQKINKRAEELQEAVEEFQQAMRPKDD